MRDHVYLPIILTWKKRGSSSLNTEATHFNAAHRLREVVAVAAAAATAVAALEMGR